VENGCIGLVRACADAAEANGAVAEAVSEGGKRKTMGRVVELRKQRTIRRRSKTTAPHGITHSIFAEERQTFETTCRVHSRKHHVSCPCLCLDRRVASKASYRRYVSVCCHCKVGRLSSRTGRDDLEGGAEDSLCLFFLCRSTNLCIFPLLVCHAAEAAVGKARGAC
jgi:hypothetical protein